MMAKWKERNNEDKEDVLEFGTEEGNECRLLRNWIEENEDVKTRNKGQGKVSRVSDFQPLKRLLARVAHVRLVARGGLREEIIRCM